MSEDLNNEVIKIFIEGWLVRYDNFLLIHNFVEKEINNHKVMFRLIEGNLELYIPSTQQILKAIQIQKIESAQCIAFAMQAYIEIKKSLMQFEEA